MEEKDVKTCVKGKNQKVDKKRKADNERQVES